MAQVRRVAGTEPAALELVAAMFAEVGVMYEPGLPQGPTAHPHELSPPGGGFVVLTEDGRPVAGGGVKRLDDRACELKRMYVVPEARGRGVGRELLAALEALARDLGYAVARLDTSAWGEKRLASGDRTSGSRCDSRDSRTFALDDAAEGPA